jgi:hypothetical protein
MKTHEQRITKFEAAITTGGPIIHAVDYVGQPTVLVGNKDIPRAEFEALMASPEGKRVSVIQVEYIKIPIADQPDESEKGPQKADLFSDL